MPIIRVGKVAVAERQINAAIRMTFDGGDPVAIHSLICPAHRIVRDLCEQRGDVESYLRFTDWIKPGHESEFWAAWNASANFVKHAAEDPEGILELDDEAADFLIVFTSKWFGDLGHARSAEMRVFAGWWTYLKPHLLKPNILAAAGIAEKHAEMVRAMASLSRREQLSVGRSLLDAERGKH